MKLWRDRPWVKNLFLLLIVVLCAIGIAIAIANKYDTLQHGLGTHHPPLPAKEARRRTTR